MAADYEFNEDYERLLRHLTHPLGYLSQDFITFPPKSFLELCVEKELAKNFEQPPTPLAGLGKLGVLPVEVLLEMFEGIDISSLFNLRRVSHLTRELVSTLKLWRLLVKSDPVVNALRAILQCGIASFFTLQDLYQALCSRNCVECGATARLLFLPRLSRCCHRCLNKCSRFAMVRFPDDRDSSTHLDKIRKSGMTVLLSIPGQYTNISDAPQHARRNLLLRNEVKAMRIPGISKVCQNRWLRLRFDVTNTYQATIAFPYLDQEDMKVRMFLACLGCNEYYGRYSRGAESVFTRDNYLPHFLRCCDAQERWERKKGRKETW